MSNLIVFPVSLLIITLFRKSRARTKRPSRVEQALREERERKEAQERERQEKEQQELEEAAKAEQPAEDETGSLEHGDGAGDTVSLKETKRTDHQEDVENQCATEDNRLVAQLADFELGMKVQKWAPGPCGDLNLRPACSFRLLMTEFYLHIRLRTLFKAKPQNTTKNDNFPKIFCPIILSSGEDPRGSSATGGYVRGMEPAFPSAEAQHRPRSSRMSEAEEVSLAPVKRKEPFRSVDTWGNLFIL